MTSSTISAGHTKRKWNHSRYYQHSSMEKLIEDKIDVPDTHMAGQSDSSREPAFEYPSCAACAGATSKATASALIR